MRAMTVLTGGVSLIAGTLLIVTFLSDTPADIDISPDWPGFEGGAAASHYSGLNEINRDNVTELEVVWQYHLGDTNVSTEPLVLSDRLIVVSEDRAIAALDPSTGLELWRTESEQAHRATRGFAYWRSEDGGRQRVFFPTATGLNALDPVTGKIIADFHIDLRQGLRRDPESIRRISPSSPGRVFENLIIVGSITGENYGSPPGDVRAFDVRTGELAWTFHTIPRPGDLGHESWPQDAWTYAGGANAWGGHTVDEERGIVFIATGSAVYDFYGADRLGDNLFANSLIALDARTGKYLWHFQAVRHDLWDYDMAASPTLLTVREGGKEIPAVAAAGKTGFLYVFNRVTGEALYPIEDRPVPASNVPGEWASPTQPFSALPPFARQSFTADDIDPLMPEAERLAFAERLSLARNEGIFTPPELGRETVQMPGNHGGANWGQTGAAPDGQYYVVSIDLPAMLKLEPPDDPQALQRIALKQGRGAAVYAQYCRICHGADKTGQAGIPALTDLRERLSRSELETIVRDGQTTMPGFSHLPDTDIDLLIVYLLSGVSSPPEEPTAGQDAPPAPASSVSAHSPDGSIRYRSGYNLVDFVIRPPWQTLTSYDLNTGEILWQTPVGTMAGRDEPTGRAMIKGGLLITSGGLVFVATEADRRLHAFDTRSGQSLWSGELPAHPRGGLVTYSFEGRQYIVVPAGFSGAIPSVEIPGTEPGANSYVAFALPESTRGNASDIK